MARGLQRIVEETGLSLATVSRALNDSDKVTAKTKAIVLEAAQRIGYSPNAAARALVTRRNYTIGAVIPTLESSIFSTFIHAIEDTLIPSGYALVIATTDNDPDIEEQRARDLFKMGAEGLIVSGLQHNDSFFEFLDTHQIPAIATSIYREQASLPTIGYDNEALGHQAATYLAGLRHRNIGLIHGPTPNNDRTRLRIAGVQSVYPDARLCEVPLTVEGGVEACKSLLSGDQPPSAILCLSDVLALGVLFEAPRMGVSIPDQLSVMGFDDLEWASVSNPPLTTISLPVVAMGQDSATALIRKLEDGTNIQSQCLTSSIIERRSTRKLN